MQHQWRTVAPPMNVSLAAFIGFKPKPKAKAVEAMSEDEFGREMRDLEAFFSGLG